MGESLWAICVYLVCGQDYVIVIECNNLLNPIPVSCFMSKYDKWYSLESSYALLKEFPKNFFAKLVQSVFLCPKS